MNVISKKLSETWNQRLKNVLKLSLNDLNKMNHKESNLEKVITYLVKEKKKKNLGKKLNFYQIWKTMKMF